MQKTIKENAGRIVVSLLEILTGILLLIDPAGFTAGIVTIVGIFLLLTGIADVVRYFRTNAAAASVEQSLAKGLLGIVAGAFCMLHSHWLIALFPLLTVLYGIAALVLGLFKVQFMADMLRLRRSRWWLAAISALLSILCAVIILSNPFSSTVILWTFTAVSLILEAVLDMVAVFLSFRKKGNAETTERRKE